jgi:hypothetical protein
MATNLHQHHCHHIPGNFTSQSLFCTYYPLACSKHALHAVHEIMLHDQQASKVTLGSINLHYQSTLPYLSIKHAAVHNLPASSILPVHHLPEQHDDMVLQITSNSAQRPQRQQQHLREK